MKNWRYSISRIIPMHFTSEYGVEEDGAIRWIGITWWQWREQVFNVQRS